MRTYKPRNREKLIEQANRNALTHLLKTNLTIDEKRTLIAETNPLLYLFGTVLNPNNWEKQYEDQTDITSSTNSTTKTENNRHDLSI